MVKPALWERQEAHVLCALFHSITHTFFFFRTLSHLLSTSLFSLSLLFCFSFDDESMYSHSFPPFICLYCFFFFVATPFFLSSYEGCYEVVAGEKFKFRLEMMVEEQCATDLFPTLQVVVVVCLFVCSRCGRHNEEDGNNEEAGNNDHDENIMVVKKYM